MKEGQAELREGQRALLEITARLEAKVLPRAEPQRAAPLSPELQNAARTVLERGSLEQRAVAEIALNRHAEAGALLSQLKRDVVGDAFRLLLLEGHNWYRAGEYEQAITPYRQAVALRPEDGPARHSLALALVYSPLGDRAAHLAEAIQLCDQLLATEEAGTKFWAELQRTRAIAFCEMPLGDRRANLRQGIEGFRRALDVVTRDANPGEWAALQANLGLALGTGGGAAGASDAEMAVACFEAALAAAPAAEDPRWRGITLHNLGYALSRRRSGERKQNLDTAVQACEEALAMQDSKTAPVDRARTQITLGTIWLSYTREKFGDKSREALASLEAALGLLTKSREPLQWARANNAAAEACLLAPGEPGGKARRALVHAGESLSVTSAETNPFHWAEANERLGDAWSLLASEQADANERAIRAYRSALSCFAGISTARRAQNVRVKLERLTEQGKSGSGGDA